MTKNSQELNCQNEDGFLGKFSPGTRFNINVILPDRKKLHPMVVHRGQDRDGQHTITRLQGEHFDNGEKYSFAVELEGRPPHGHTRWPMNQIHIVLFGDRGAFKLIQISLPTQNNAIFLRAQKLFQGQVVFNQEEEMLVDDPQFVHWQKLLEFIIQEIKGHKLRHIDGSTEKLTWDWVDEIPQTHIPLPPPKYIDKDIPVGQAIVQFWNDSGNFGWAVASLPHEYKVLAKIHWSQIQMQGFRRLDDGEMIKFEDAVVLPHTNGPDHGQPRFELKAVRPIS